MTQTAAYENEQTTSPQATKTAAYAAMSATTPIEPFAIERRAPRPNNVAIDILYCGVCHSDIHQARDEWGGSIFPMVPGHEIVGRVSSVGSAVTGFKVGDLAGVGCMVDSCRVCANCKDGEEQYCNNPHATYTYNGRDTNGEVTYGGYSTSIVVDESFVLHISHKLDLAGAAPLLCAGITTYSPLRHWNVGEGTKLGVMGLGGLGHMGLKFGHAFGAHVVQFTTSPNKVADAKKLGANEVVISTNAEQNGVARGNFRLHSRHHLGAPRHRRVSQSAQARWSAVHGRGARCPALRARVFAARQARVARGIRHWRNSGDAGDARFLRRAWYSFGHWR